MSKHSKESAPAGVCVRVRSTHGMPRAAHVGGTTAWFHPTESDVVVTPEELEALRADPILHVHDMSNGFSAEDVARAKADVLSAEQLLDAARANLARVCARGPAANVADGVLDIASILPTDEMVRPEDVAPLPKPMAGSPKAYLEELAVPQPEQSAEFDDEA